MVALPFLAALTALQTGASPARSDSAHLHRVMVDAQREFESTRRRLLPISTSGSGRCDERVGRFCYWYDSDEPPPPEEPESIRKERSQFLALLAQAGDRLPGDQWILSQRVRYLIEQGATDSAIALSESCARWWCDALKGYALHVHGDVAEAERSFDRALSGMPGMERCRWNDLEVVLEPEDRKLYQKLDCNQRDSANAVLFWRATPLFVRPGNDARTEWYSRHTLVRALDGAITHHGMRLGSDHREMLLRYGWATAYGRRPETRGPMQEIDVVGHEPKPALPFLVQDQRERWPPVIERPRARFAPVFTHLIEPLEDVQLARFRRGDSVLVIAGFTASHDTLFTGEDTQVSLAVSEGPDRSAEMVSAPIIEGRGSVAAAAIASVPQLVSLEVNDSSARAWAVKRVNYREALPAISDLLLTVTRENLPGSVEEAATLAWRGIRIPRGSVVGLYWESYGHASTDSLVQVSLTVEAVKPGFLGRVSQTLGLRRKVPPLRLAWSRSYNGGDSTIAHAVEVDLSRLSPGSYLLHVEMDDGRRAARQFQILPADRLLAREPNTPQER